MPGGLREGRLWKDRVGGKARGASRGAAVGSVSRLQEAAVPAKMFGQSWGELGRKVSESFIFAGCRGVDFISPRTLAEVVALRWSGSAPGDKLEGE